MSESTSITMDQIASAAIAEMPEVVNVRCKSAWLSNECSGAWLSGRRKWSRRYFAAASCEAIEDENAGELSRSSFVWPIVRDPYLAVCVLVEMPPLTWGGLGGWAAWVAGDPLLLISRGSSAKRRVKRL